jgi:hypothetical protein
LQVLDKYIWDRINYDNLVFWYKITGIQPVYIFTCNNYSILSLVFLFYSILWFRKYLKNAFNAVVNTCILLYPTLKTIESIEKISNNIETPSDKQWSSFWIIYSLVQSLEKFKLFTALIPLYGTFKPFFYVWLIHPKTLGASIIYKNVIRKYFASSKTFARISSFISGMEPEEESHRIELSPLIYSYSDSDFGGSSDMIAECLLSLKN